MTEKNGFFRKLKIRLFNIKKDADSKESVAKPKKKPSNKSSFYQDNFDTTKLTQRDPYFIQIGFDFGTSYSKCVCRDVMTNKSWIHFPPGLTNEELPFLIPSTLLIKRGKIRLSKDISREYHQNGLYHIKLAIEKIALKQWNDPVLRPYKEALGDVKKEDLTNFVINNGVYFLSKAFVDVKNDIVNRYSDYGKNKNDYIAINLAVPVADAEHITINNLFHKVLYIAWSIATKDRVGHGLGQDDLEQLVETHKNHCSKEIVEACYIYPEVSANVQGFVRSRVSKPGIYLFSDTGAGTVDQSIFIFHRKDGAELLTYLHGSVLPEGSSYIEQHAAIISGDLSWENLEKWRRRKEIGGVEPELQKARNKVHVSLSKGTKINLSKALKKLYVKKQLNDIRIIFGGGGYCEHPYKTAVMKAFESQFFSKGFLPDVVGLPIPKDLEINGRKNRWMSRLFVAYGLSFVRSDLASNIYPKDLKDPESNEIQTVQIRAIDEAPTKDVC